MKNILILSCLVLSFTAFSKDLSSKKELLKDIKEETKKCVVRSTTNGQDIGFKSVCNTLVIVSSDEAHLLIDGEWIAAKIKESPESDGGDLDDLVITDSKGKVLATKTNVPAYDNVIIAMAGDIDLDNDNNISALFN